ncbi:hypothetical protein D3C75_946070 [compost metagenome]
MNNGCNLLLTEIGGFRSIDLYTSAGCIPDSCASRGLSHETQGYVCGAIHGDRSGGQLLGKTVNRCPAAADFQADVQAGACSGDGFRLGIPEHLQSELFKDNAKRNKYGIVLQIRRTGGESNLASINIDPDRFVCGKSGNSQH